MVLMRATTSENGVVSEASREMRRNPLKAAIKSLALVAYVMVSRVGIKPLFTGIISVSSVLLARLWLITLGSVRRDPGKAEVFGRDGVWGILNPFVSLNADRQKL